MNGEVERSRQETPWHRNPPDVHVAIEAGVDRERRAVESAGSEHEVVGANSCPAIPRGIRSWKKLQDDRETCAPTHLGSRHRDPCGSPMQGVARERTREPPAEPLRRGSLSPPVGRQIVESGDKLVEAVASQEPRVDVEALDPAAPGRQRQARPHGQRPYQPEALLADETARRLRIGNPEDADIAGTGGLLVKTARKARQGDPLARCCLRGGCGSAHIVAYGVHGVEREEKPALTLAAAPHLRNQAQMRDPGPGLVDVADDRAADRILEIEPAQIRIAREHGGRKGISEKLGGSPKIETWTEHPLQARPRRSERRGCVSRLVHGFSSQGKTDRGRLGNAPSRPHCKAPRYRPGRLSRADSAREQAFAVRF